MFASKEFYKLLVRETNTYAEEVFLSGIEDQSND
jgi:hypothetical protein